MSLVTELQTQLRSSAERLDAVVVSIGRDHRGSGVVIGPDRVVTNAHNLRDRTVQITFADGRATQGRLVGAAPAHDLVVLEVATGDVQPLAWSDTADAAGLGAIVVAGARDGGGLRVTAGTVSQASRSFRGPGGRPISVALEHTAPLSRGSSGGPLTDLDGRLVAINTHRLGKGFTAAQPVTAELRAIIEDLSAGRSRRPLVLGVQVAPPHVARKLRAAVGLEARDGLLVRGVVDGSPADRAGIRSGDLLVALAGEPLATSDELFARLAVHSSAEPLTVGVVRGADESEVHVRFDEPAEGEADQVPGDSVNDSVSDEPADD